jgi:hypothetical protein
LSVVLRVALAVRYSGSAASVSGLPPPPGSAGFLF